MKIIGSELFDNTTRAAKSSRRKRMNHNFHALAADPFQRMLNAMEPGTYVRPHKHENPDKREVFIALRGTLCVVEFNNNGTIKQYCIISHDAEVSAVEIAERCWHTIICLQSGSVAYEAKDGPYNPADDKNFAPWAPPENSPEADKYLQRLIENLGLQLR